MSAHLVVRLEADLDAEVRKLAEDEDRTLGSVIRLALRRFLAERGLAA